MDSSNEAFHEYSHEVVAEPTLYHPALHDPAPETRLDGVEQFAERSQRINELPSEELRALQTEFAELPEVVAYGNDPVKLSFWHEQVHQLPAEVLEKSVTPQATLGDLLSSVETMLDNSIVHYAEAIRSFKRTELKRFTLEPDDFRAYMGRVDLARRTAHESLLSSVNSFSRAINQNVPRLLPTDQRGDWEKLTRKNWFDLARIKNRTAIGEWAIRTEMFNKSQLILQAIAEVLKKKNEANP